MRESWTHVNDGILRLALHVGEFRSMRLAVEAMRHLRSPMTFVASPYHPDLVDDDGHAFSEEARRLGHLFRSDARTNPGLIYLRPFAEQAMDQRNRNSRGKMTATIAAQVANTGR